MNPTRTIIHLDLDAFFCAVEEKRDPTLRGKAFAVGGDPAHRGVVASCSYAARQFGVRSAMPMFQAVRVCPGLITVTPHRSAYKRDSDQVMEILHALTDQVEQLSIDEAFIDISLIDEPPTKVAKNLQERIQKELSLPCSLGIASNKLVAKIATDVGKVSAPGGGYPRSMTRVPPGQEAAFLAPLPADMLWGVGPKTKQRLHQLGMRTIGDIANFPIIELSQALGKHGYDLSKRAKGIDHRPILTKRVAKSISNERTFSQDKGNKAEILHELSTLSDKVARRLRKKSLRGRTVQIKVRWANFDTLTRQITLTKGVNDYETISTQAEALFEEVWKSGRAIRLVGVGVSNLDRGAHQLNLWGPKVKKDVQLQKVLGELRQKYGKDVISEGIQD